jgi:hypothetical protein
MCDILCALPAATVLRGSYQRLSVGECVTLGRILGTWGRALGRGVCGSGAVMLRDRGSPGKGTKVRKKSGEGGGRC